MRFGDVSPRARVPRVGAALAAGLVGAAALVALPVPASVAAAGAAPAPHAYPGGQVVFTGHGWGHGVGMGQWGALGYAIGQDGGLGPQTYQWILGHYYGGTTLTTTPASADTQSITVAITGNNDQFVIATAPGGVTLPTGGTAQAVMFQPTSGSSTWNVYAGSDCSGGSDKWGAPVGTTTSPSTGAVGGGVVTLCQTGATYHGQLEATYNTGTSPALRTVDVLSLGQYLDDVVPSESPSTWGSLGAAGPQGEPWGFQALEAQAVAARSYALAYVARGGYFGYADICDSTACQSYPGTKWENSLASAAVTDTAGQVLTASGGAIADTEYSSSTGGYTAGGAFPAVVDAGDAVCVPSACNSNHTWTKQVPVSTIEAQWPQIGTLQSVDVTKRNGLGDWGGRVTSVDLVGTASTVTVTGSQLAGQLGLQSDWFTVSGTPSGGVGGYWFDAADGGVFSFGDATFYGSMGGQPLNQPVVGMAATADHGGYWQVASDGGIFAFGDAGFYGSMGGQPLNQPVVGMAAAPDGGGYWMVAADGGVFAFGDAGFYGSTGSLHLVRPVTGMAATPDGGGYWMVASDGGVFAFGDAPFEGSAAGTPGGSGAAVLLPTATGGGYVVASASGSATSFGDAPSLGDVATAVPGYPGHLVGGATTP